MKKAKKFVINYMGGKYWYQPSIWTISMSGWAARPFWTFDKLVEALDYSHEPCNFDFNKDEQFMHFNAAQKLHNIPLRLTADKAKESNNHILVDIHKNISILFDDKSIKLIKSGKFFCWPLDTFKELAKENKIDEDKEKIILTWRKWYFDVEKVPLELEQK